EIKHKEEQKFILREAERGSPVASPSDYKFRQGMRYDYDRHRSNTGHTVQDKGAGYPDFIQQAENRQPLFREASQFPGPIADVVMILKISLGLPPDEIFESVGIRVDEVHSIRIVFCKRGKLGIEVCRRRVAKIVECNGYARRRQGSNGGSRRLAGALLGTD